MYRSMVFAIRNCCRNRNINPHNKNISCANVQQRRFLSVQDSSKNKGPITWKNFAIVCGIGGFAMAFTLYIKHEKDQALLKERKRQLGKMAIGGQWDLIDTEGVSRKSKDFLGKWLLIYFGFTHCPDICPDEIEKMSAVVDDIEEKDKECSIQPIFITVDPERDTKEVVGKYVREFSPKLLGLTGSVEQINKVCKAFRVYFSAGPRDNTNDYIVDHTIIMYLINPDGEFVDYYGQNLTKEQCVDSIMINMAKWKSLNKTSWFN